MNILKRGAIALVVAASIGGGAALATAGQASASGLTVINATSVETSAHFVAPNVEALTFNLYQPSVVAPGFRLYASISELCLVGRLGNAVCNWRLTTNAVPLLQTELVGNAVIPRIGFGQAGNITGGTKAWRGARGLFRSINIAPNVASDTFVFSTP